MRSALVLILMVGCAPLETTEVRAGERSFLPTAAFAAKGTAIRDGLGILGSGGRRTVNIVVFVATDADVACADFAAAAGTCAIGAVVADANVLELEIDVRDTIFGELLGEGLGDYDVPTEALVRLSLDDGTLVAAPERGQLDLARFGDDGAAVSYAFEDGFTGEPPSIEDGAVVAARCGLLDEVFVDCE